MNSVTVKMSLILNLNTFLCWFEGACSSCALGVCLYRYQNPQRKTHLLLLSSETTLKTSWHVCVRDGGVCEQCEAFDKEIYPGLVWLLP